MVPVKYENARDFGKDGIAVVQEYTYWKYIDSVGKIIIKKGRKNAWSFCGGRGRITVGGKYGFVDQKGSLVIEAELESAEDFSENGVAVFGEKGKYGAIDIYGNVIVEAKYDRLSRFNEQGYAVAKENGKYELISGDGTAVTSPEYDAVGKMLER